MKFFSILLPTKNRPEYLKTTLESINRQSDSDYELILVDNSDDDLSLQAFKRASNDNFRYIKTGNLSMVDNWNYALDQAKGKWVLLLEDKQSLHFDALKMLRLKINEFNVSSVLCFRGDFYNDVDFKDYGYVQEVNYSLKVEKLKSKKILENYKNTLFNHREKIRLRIDEYLPMPHHSVISAELLKKVKDIFGAHCHSCSPDFTGGFSRLLATDHIYMYDYPIYLMTTLKVSNGMRTATDRHEAHLREINYLPENYLNELKRMPFNQISMTNAFYLDFLSVNKMIKEDYKIDYSNVDYFRSICNDLFNVYMLKNLSKIRPEIIVYLNSLRKARQTKTIKFYLILYMCYLIGKNSTVNSLIFLNKIIKKILWINLYSQKSVKISLYSGPLEYLEKKYLDKCSLAESNR
jgi:glycosyltransferase involved in cell wall biosynthesis